MNQTVCTNGCRIYMDIMTGKRVAVNLGCYLPVIYFTVSSSSRRRVDGAKGMDGENIYPAESFTLLENTKYPSTIKYIGK